MSWKHYTPYLSPVEVDAQQFAMISAYLKMNPEKDIGDVRVRFDVAPEVIDEVIRQMKAEESED